MQMTTLHETGHSRLNSCTPYSSVGGAGAQLPQPPIKGRRARTSILQASDAAGKLSKPSSQGAPFGRNDDTSTMAVQRCSRHYSTADACPFDRADAAPVPVPPPRPPCFSLCVPLNQCNILYCLRIGSNVKRGPKSSESGHQLSPTVVYWCKVITTASLSTILLNLQPVSKSAGMTSPLHQVMPRSVRGQMAYSVHQGRIHTSHTH